MASHTNPAITANGGATRLTLVFLWLAAACFGLGSAEDVPLPKSRPSVWLEPHTFREAAGPDFDSGHVTSAPTEYDQRLRAIAAIEPVRRLICPGASGGGGTGPLRLGPRPAGLAWSSTRCWFCGVPLPNLSPVGFETKRHPA